MRVAIKHLYRQIIIYGGSKRAETKFYYATNAVLCGAVKISRGDLCASMPGYLSRNIAAGLDKTPMNPCRVRLPITYVSRVTGSVSPRWWLSSRQYAVEYQ
jgi:hypothetical protein